MQHFDEEFKKQFWIIMLTHSYIEYQRKKIMYRNKLFIFRFRTTTDFEKDLNFLCAIRESFEMKNL